MTLVLARLAVIAVVLAATSGLEARVAHAQEASTARISGRVTSGTQGDRPPDGLAVQLIGLDGAAVAATIEAPLRDGRFEATVPATPQRTYVPHLVYQGVDYFAEPVAFMAGARDAQRDFLVYAATTEAPPLSITSTAVTVLAIDRERGQIGLERVDLVANPTDRVFVGDASGTTLRIPAPEGTIDAGGEHADGAFAFEGGVVTTTVPLRPGALTSIVTRYVVGYDPAADRYRLRVTAPVTSQRVAVRVPAAMAGSLEPRAGAKRADDERSGESAEAQVLKVVQSTATLPPGGGVLVDIVGLSGSVQSNPLTARAGAPLAAALALAIVGGAVAFAAVRRRRADTTRPAGRAS